MKEKLVKFDSNHNPTVNEYNKLRKADRDVLDDFEKYCLISASPARAKKSKSNAIRFLVMVEKKIDDIYLKDLRDFLRVLKKSDFSDYYKNDVKGFVQRFLKWYFKDWSTRFNNFEDIKYNSDAQRAEKIQPDDVLSSEDVGKLIREETSIFWKTFVICQYEGALRTIECRQLKWDMIDKEDCEVYWLNVESKKNKNSTIKERIAPPLDQAIYYLDELKKWQEENNKVSPYVFPSKLSVNNYISSGTVSKWFSRLTKKALGKSVKNYVLRHSKGEELHKLIREGKLSKENALQMMGHSEKMFDKTYSHANKQEMKKVLKKQVVDIDYIAPEKKYQLEKDVEQHRMEILELKEKIEDMKKFGAVANNLFEDKKLQKLLLQSMMKNGLGKQLIEMSSK
jgi:integrase